MAPRRHWTGSVAALIAPPPLKASDPLRPRARTWLQASSPARLELVLTGPPVSAAAAGVGGAGANQPTTTPTTCTVGLQLRLMTGQEMLRCEDLAQAAAGGGAGGPSVALVRGSGGGGGGNAGGNSNDRDRGVVPWLLVASSSATPPTKPTCHLVFRFFDPSDGADFAQGLAAIARQRLAASAAAPSALPSAALDLVSPGQRASLEAAIRRAVASRLPAEEALAALEQELAAVARRSDDHDDEGEEGGGGRGRAAVASATAATTERQLEALVALVDAMWDEAEARRKEPKQQARPQKRKAAT